MANLIIKPSAGGDLVIKGSDDSPAITVGTTGQATFAEPATMSGNVTMSGTANNLGTVTAGSIAGGAITSATTFPVGHIINSWHVTHSFDAYASFDTSTTWALVDFGSSKTLQITGITATVGNLLHLTSTPSDWYQEDAGTYAMQVGFHIDATGYSVRNLYQNVTFPNYKPLSLSMIFTVPASFTSKTISVYARNQTGSGGTQKLVHRGTLQDDKVCHLSIFEIQQ